MSVMHGRLFSKPKHQISITLCIYILVMYLPVMRLIICVTNTLHDSVFMFLFLGLLTGFSTLHFVILDKTMEEELCYASNVDQKIL